MRYSNGDIDRDFFDLGFTDYVHSSQEFRSFTAAVNWYPVRNLKVGAAVTRTIAQRYADDMQLSTEHALLEDNGDGRGSELQIDYLTEELGGRAQEGVKPPARLENADGHQAAAIELPEPPPMAPAEAPAAVPANESASPN